MYLMRLIGLANGAFPTPFDGQYLKEYDPCRSGTDPDGKVMNAHVVSTPRVEEAMHFPDLMQLWECWKQVDHLRPLRIDGKPNRPLKAFSIESVREDVALAESRP